MEVAGRQKNSKTQNGLNMMARAMRCDMSSTEAAEINSCLLSKSPALCSGLILSLE